MLRGKERLFSNLRAAALTMAVAACARGQEPYRDVDASMAATLLREPTVFLLDVRTPRENEAARIAGATLIPLSDLDKRKLELPKDKQRPVLIYCRSGRRSTLATKILADLGYGRVYNLKGGLIGWQKNGGPVESGPPVKGQ